MEVSGERTWSIHVFWAGERFSRRTVVVGGVLGVRRERDRGFRIGCRFVVDSVVCSADWRIEISVLWRKLLSRGGFEVVVFEELAMIPRALLACTAW